MDNDNKQCDWCGTEEGKITTMRNVWTNVTTHICEKCKEKDVDLD